MKLLKNLSILLLLLSIAVMLVACGGSKKCKNHFDTNGDGICEECGKEAKPQTIQEKDLTLFENGEIKFQIVLGNDISTDAETAVDGLKSRLADLGVELSVVSDEAETIVDCEVLIGKVTTRGIQYIYDTTVLGYNGYTQKIVGNKLVITGGSDESLLTAFTSFVEEILCIFEDTTEIGTVIMKSDDSTEYIQNEFDITSLKINGNDVKDYTIAADLDSDVYYPVAKNLRDAIHKEAGILLNIVPLEEKSDKSIVLTHVQKDDTGADSFRINVRGNTLYIESEYDNCVVERAEYFIAKYISTAEGEVNFTGKILEEDHSVVTYEQFGAKGDGKTNDFAAIKAAHDYANEGGQTVQGRTTATYYISSSIIDSAARTIVIKTPTDWQNANFIIDDSNLSHVDPILQYNVTMFSVQSYNETTYASGEQIAKINAEGKLGPHTTKIDLGLGYRAMLNIINDKHKVYVRYGGNASRGSSQQEVVVVKPDGTIEEGTELLLDYDTVTSITIFRADDEPMEIKNATFTTYASSVSTTIFNEDGTKKTVHSSSFARNFVIRRPNTTALNLNHYVENEISAEDHRDKGITGPNYTGFFSANSTTDVLYKNCIMSGRRYYGISGTYDFGAKLVNNITLDTCTQHNFYVDGELSTKKNVAGVTNYWGIGGTNFCKNMEYVNCELTRFDAHSGLYNGKIKDSHIAMVNLIGGGDMLIENSTIDDNEFFTLRTDYGATWNGTITIRGSVLSSTSDTGRILSMVWTNHDFGYVCHFPNLILEDIRHTGSARFDLTVTSDTSDPNQDTLSSWGNYIHIKDTPRQDYAKEPLLNVENKVNVNPLAPPDFIVVTSNKYNCMFYLNSTLKFFENTTVRGFNGYPEYDPNVDTDIPLD